MGIIRSQSIKNSLISFAAAMIGAINMLIIYENFLTPSELGKVKYLSATAFLLLPFVMLGITTTMLRFFPKFENRERGHHGILGFSLGYVVFGYILYLVLTLLFFSQLPGKFQDNYVVISGILFFIAISSVFTSYLSCLKKIAIPTVFNNLWIKIGVSLLVVMYHLGWFEFRELEWNLITVYALAAVAMVAYTWFLKALFLKPDLSILSPEIKSEIRSYVLYSTLGPMGAVLMTQLDQFMVTEILEYNDNGIYTMAVYFGSLFTIPMLSVFSIANPIISDSSERGDRGNIYMIYRKSSITLLIVGILGLILIWASIDDVFGLMSKGDVYSQGKYVVLLLSIAKIIDMATSVNGAIIAHSRHFRFNLYALLILGGLNIFANYYFINSMGINGAALATLTALTLFNLAKFIFVWKKFDMQPFEINSLKLLIIGAVVFVGSLFLDITFSDPLMAIIIRSAVIGLVFTLLIYVFRISDDVNLIIKNIFKKIFP